MAIATSARLTTKRARAAALPIQLGQSPPSPQFAETKKRYKTTSTGTPVRRHPAVPKCGSLSLKAWGDYGPARDDSRGWRALYRGVLAGAPLAGMAPS